jgi:hypothetical protein
MKHKNPFLGVMLFNILVLIGMIISAINCIVISNYYLLAFDIFLIIVNSAMFGWNFCKFIGYKNYIKYREMIEKHIKDELQRAENEPFKEFEDGNYKG